MSWLGEDTDYLKQKAQKEYERPSKLMAITEKRGRLGCVSF